MINQAIPLLRKQMHRMGDYIPKRQRASVDGRLLALSSITLKQPPVYDVAYNNVDSHGNPPVWANVTPRPAGVIPKATEYTTEDPTFGPNWTQLGTLDVPRMCYCFYHNGQIFYTAARQAQAFVKAILKYGPIKPNDYFVIDDEEINSKGQSLLSATEMVDFLYNVQVGLSLPDTSRLVIYSTASLLNNLSLAKLTPAQRAWLKGMSVWPAGYPNDPDQFSIPPAAYIPDQSMWGPVIMWQYAESQIITGIPGGTDLDWISPSFLIQWAGTITPTPTAKSITSMVINYSTGLSETLPVAPETIQSVLVTNSDGITITRP